MIFQGRSGAICRLLLSRSIGCPAAERTTTRAALPRGLSSQLGRLLFTPLLPMPENWLCLAFTFTVHVHLHIEVLSTTIGLPRASEQRRRVSTVYNDTYMRRSPDHLTLVAADVVCPAFLQRHSRPWASSSPPAQHAALCAPRPSSPLLFQSAALSCLHAGTQAQTLHYFWRYSNTSGAKKSGSRL